MHVVITDALDALQGCEAWQVQPLQASAGVKQHLKEAAAEATGMAEATALRLARLRAPPRAAGGPP